MDGNQAEIRKPTPVSGAGHEMYFLVNLRKKETSDSVIKIFL